MALYDRSDALAIVKPWSFFYIGASVDALGFLPPQSEGLLTASNSHSLPICLVLRFIPLQGIAACFLIFILAHFYALSTPLQK
jgi:hypothetical protein